MDLVEAISKRIMALKSEFESGQNVMAELEGKQARLREQMLRINGAIQVLEELLSESEDGAVSNVSEFQMSGDRKG